MPLKLKYNKALIVLATIILSFTVIFKYKTGSFILISEKSKREIIEYEINKRKDDITISSLKASCLDYDYVINQLLIDIDNNNATCVKKFKLSLQNQSNDSAYFKIVEQIYEHAYYYEEELTENGKIVVLYQNTNIKCLNSVKIIFENKAGESLIKEIKDFPEYLSCTCS